MKSKLLKLARNVGISVVVLLVLSVGAGVGYTWYMGQNTDESALAAPVEPSASSRRVATKRPELPPDAPVSVAVQSITSPVAPGSNASVTIRTLPGSICTVKVEYGEEKVLSTDSGLREQTADDFGLVTWAWTVEANVPLGEWPVTMSCVRNEMSGVVKADLVVAVEAKP